MKIKNMFILGALICTSLSVLAGSAPVITTQPKSQAVNEWDSVTFSVTATGEGIEHKNFTSTLSDTVNLDMVWCPPGAFIMGSPKNETGRSNEPQHQVTLTKGFWIGKYEVTQEQYKTIVGSNPSHFSGDNLPVEQVDWFDAISFCEKLTAFEKGAGRLAEGYEYTLPTEAQWEYACRAGTKGIYNVDGASLGDVAWYYNNSGMKSHPVGQKIPNAWGIYDMHGNIFELCLDWNEEYSTDAVTDPKGTSSGNLRILRGGSWYDAPSVCRSATRIDRSPNFKDDKRGIRVVLVESGNSESSNLSYQWYKNGFMLQGAIDKEYTIDSVNQSDAGQYFVVVSNESGSLTSDVATLTVKASLEITQQPVGVSVSGGESATFSVEAENATSYQWYRNGFAIGGADQSSYTIDAVTSYDIGKYFVIVSNERTNIVSDVATLEISEAYRAKAEAIVANGFVIGFVITDPGWGYEWTPNIRIKDENGNGAEARCVMENGMIVGIEIDEPGSGYTKDATVKIGSPYNFDSLSIQASEVLITMYVNLGEKYQLECTEDHITWKKVGEPFIAEDEEVQLRLEVVDHSYYFRVHEVK